MREEIGKVGGADARVAGLSGQFEARTVALASRKSRCPRAGLAALLFQTVRQRQLTEGFRPDARAAWPSGDRAATIRIW